MKLTPREIAYVLNNSAWREVPDEHALVIAVVLAESGGDTEAIGVNETVPPPAKLPKTWMSYDLGLFQINTYWHAVRLSRGNWRDPYFNADVAYLIRKEHKGLKAWAAYNKGFHVPFIMRAEAAVLAPTRPDPWPL